MIGRLSLRAVVLIATLTVSGIVAAQAGKPDAKPAVNPDIEKALGMDEKAAEEAVKSPNMAVRYLALKKLCAAKYDDKKLIPLLTQALDPRCVPMARLAVMELTARKHAPLMRVLFEIVLNDGADWELRKTAEACIEQLAPDLPAELKGALVLTEEKQPDGTHPPNPDKLQKAVDLYKKESAKRSGAPAPAPK